MWKFRSHHKLDKSSWLLFQALLPGAQAKTIPLWLCCCHTIGENSQAFIHSSFRPFLSASYQDTEPSITSSAVLLILGCSVPVQRHASGRMRYELGALEPREGPWPCLAKLAAFLTRLRVHGCIDSLTSAPWGPVSPLWDAIPPYHCRVCLWLLGRHGESEACPWGMGIF